jgi:hypothetical protein
MLNKNKLKLNELNKNELFMNVDYENGWYNLDNNIIFNKLIDDGYYKLKLIDDSIVESIEYIGLELNIDKFDNVLENEIGLLDGYEYINYKKN